MSVEQNITVMWTCRNHSPSLETTNRRHDYELNWSYITNTTDAIPAICPDIFYILDTLPPSQVIANRTGIGHLQKWALLLQ